MREIYRKHGVSVRFEQKRLITVHEAGEASEEDGSFHCQPLVQPTIERRATGEMEQRVRATAARVEAAVAHPLSIERLIVSEGWAHHEFGAVTWEETVQRIHLSIVHDSHRVLIDLGGFEIDEIVHIADLLPRMIRRERRGELRLAPSVTAALLPQLIGIAPPNITLMQSAGGLDGKGQRVDEWAVDATAPPNWFRPSYRVPPLRIPLNMRAVCSVTAIDERLPRAVALLAPPDGLELRLLCVDGDVAFATGLHLTRIDAIARETVWYPYGAGSFGSEMAVF